MFIKMPKDVEWSTMNLTTNRNVKVPYTSRIMFVAKCVEHRIQFRRWAQKGICVYNHLEYTGQSSQHLWKFGCCAQYVCQNWSRRRHAVPILIYPCCKIQPTPNPISKFSTGYVEPHYHVEPPGVYLMMPAFVEVLVQLGGLMYMAETSSCSTLHGTGLLQNAANIESNLKF
jgi:hypothetical protein